MKIKSKLIFIKKMAYEIGKLIIGLFLFFTGIIIFKRTFGKKKKPVKSEGHVKEAVTHKKEAEKIKKYMKGSAKRRKKIRDKYRKLLLWVLISFMLQGAVSAMGAYVVLDPEDGKKYDYGTMTNYILSLEEEKVEFLTNERRCKDAITHYSNAYISASNAWEVEKMINEDSRPPWYIRTWEAVDFYVGIVISAIIILLIR